MGVFVIGGAGFLGSHLVDRLLAEGEAVDVVDDLSTGSLANLSAARAAGGELKIHHLDAASTEADTLIAMRRPELLYHLAALPRRASDVVELAAAFGRVLAVVDAAREHGIAKVVIAVPATAVYGRPDVRDLPVRERDLEPRGVRGTVARAVVDVLQTYRDQHAVEFTALAMTNVYGPRQRASDGVVAAFAQARREGVPPRLHGDGRQTRDFLFVDDAVDALVRAGRRGGGLVVNVGTGEQTSVRDLWAAMAGPSAPVELVAGRPDDLPRFAVASARARIHLSWSAWTDLASGLRQLGD
jgi:UDP-glucose 4-epimerase